MSTTTTPADDAPVRGVIEPTTDSTDGTDGTDGTDAPDSTAPDGASAPRRCPACGEGTIAPRSGAGRMVCLEGVRATLPASLVLPSCDVCHAMVLSKDDELAMVDAVIAHRTAMARPAPRLPRHARLGFEAALTLLRGNTYEGFA